MQQKSVSIPHFLRKIIALLRKIKLQPRLLITFLAISLIPVVAIGLYAYQVYTDRFLESFVGIYTGRLDAIIRMMAIKPNAVIRW